jgi:lipid-binding SYLF domain-containing protein
MTLTRRCLATGLATTFLPVAASFAAPKSDPRADRAAAAALRKLIAGNPAAREFNKKATAVLVFPKIVKVGFILGGAYGEGALRQGDKMLGYYNSAAASYGLQGQGHSGSVTHCSS